MGSNIDVTERGIVRANVDDQHVKACAIANEAELSDRWDLNHFVSDEARFDQKCEFERRR